MPPQSQGEGPRTPTVPGSCGAAHLENAALGVDIGDTEHDDRAPVVVHCGASMGRGMGYWGVIRAADPVGPGD